MVRATKKLGLLITVMLAAQVVALAQSAEGAPRDPLSQLVSLELNNQTVFDGLAKLSQTIPISVERRLTTKESPQLDPILRFTTKVSTVSIREALDWLFKLDPRYTWTSDDGMVNVFPREVQNDPNYALNLEIEPFELRDSTKAPGAAMYAANHAKPPQHIAQLLLGETDFDKPVTITFDRMTLRQAFNRVARALCSTCGWQFSGTEKFHFMVFHKWLVPDAQPK